MINNGKMRFCCSPCNLYLPDHVCPPGPEPWCNPSWVQYSENASTKWTQPTQPASTAQSGEPEQSDIVISINQEHSVRYRDKTCLVTRSSHVTFPYLWLLETIIKSVLNVSQSDAFSCDNWPIRRQEMSSISAVTLWPCHHISTDP